MVHIKQQLHLLVKKLPVVGFYTLWCLLVHFYDVSHIVLELEPYSDCLKFKVEVLGRSYG